MRSHEDGSASVWVGNIDRAYGMQWEVELVLKPGSTLLEERVTLYNRSDLRHRYYWWNNAGVQVWDDSRIEYPMRFVASHGFTDVYRWPIDAQGRDLSLIKDQTDGPVSLFVHGSHEPFMGVWNPHTQTGVAHFAEYRDLPAKKIWSWGVDASGLEWRTALSDNNSAYAEVQAGLFRNQETFAFLEPGQYHSLQRVLDARARNRRNLPGKQSWRGLFRSPCLSSIGCFECERTNPWRADFIDSEWNSPLDWNRRSCSGENLVANRLSKRCRQDDLRIERQCRPLAAEAD